MLLAWVLCLTTMAGCDVATKAVDKAIHANRRDARQCTSTCDCAGKPR